MHLIFSILKGEANLDQEIDEQSAYELHLDKPVEVSYNPVLPPEAFAVIIIDECHRSIYGLWRQVLKYFDAHLIGLTVTQTKQTFGFFRQNLVMEDSHEQAVTDGVNVDFTVYKIETAITKAGSVIEGGDFAGFAVWLKDEDEAGVGCALVALVDGQHQAHRERPEAAPARLAVLLD